MSAWPLVAHCQHAYKRFALSVRLTVLLYKTLLAKSLLTLYKRKTSLKLVYYCTLMSMAHHFDALNHSTSHHIL